MRVSSVELAASRNSATASMRGAPSRLASREARVDPATMITRNASPVCSGENPRVSCRERVVKNKVAATTVVMATAARFAPATPGSRNRLARSARDKPFSRGRGPVPRCTGHFCLRPANVAILASGGWEIVTSVPNWDKVTVVVTDAC